MSAALITALISDGRLGLGNISAVAPNGAFCFGPFPNQLGVRPPPAGVTQRVEATGWRVKHALRGGRHAPPSQRNSGHHAGGQALDGGQLPPVPSSLSPGRGGGALRGAEAGARRSPLRRKSQELSAISGGGSITW